MNVLKIASALKNEKLRWTVFSISLLSCGALLFQNCSAKPVNTAAYSSNGTPTTVTCSITFTDTNFTQTLALYSTVTAYDSSGASLVRTCTKKYNGVGELDGASTFSLQFAPAAPAVVGTHTVAAGRDFSCGTIHGALKCWGFNGDGALGKGATSTQEQFPIGVVGTSGLTFSDISAGWGTTCGIASGALYCWGRNDLGELGKTNNSNLLENYAPKIVASMDTGVTRVSVGLRNVCAIKSGGLYCWGYNRWGQLGYGDLIDRNAVPAKPVPGFSSGTIDVSTGGYYDGNTYPHTCAINSIGELYCWGYNAQGEVGVGTTTEYYSTPQKVTNSAGFTRVSADGLHTCAIQSGVAKCWGWNPYGQLGNNSTLNSSAPVNVIGMPATSVALEIEIGTYHSCGLFTGGEIMCWGHNGQGQVGNSNTGADHWQAVQVNGLASGVTELHAGNRHNCVIQKGVAKCFGENQYYKLGDTLGLNNPIPALVFGQ